ncbi:MAG: glycosyltransferase family 39 protein [Alphaproteobacteria bacterium]|nr:glycosyltransferase family 39 protein [Alphaproteobacteria bacterium]
MFKGLLLKDNFKPVVQKILFLNLLVVMGYIGLLSVYQLYPEGDIIEHIHVAYLVGIGEVPYLDFFEHHNPLLWYMFGWLVKLFEGNVEVVGIVSYLTYLFFLIGCWYLYKIVVEFLDNGNKEAGLLSVILVLCPSVMLYYLYFKPDNYMFTTLTIGAYYLFSYMRDKKTKDLVISFLALWVSFLFIQKAILYYPVFGGVVCYLLYKKEMSFKDFLWAVALPIIGTSGLILVLYKMDMLELYWKSCFVFNTVMREHFGEHQVNLVFNEWYWGTAVFIVAGVFGALFFKLENKYFRILYLLFILTFGLKYFYFAPHHYYWYEAFYFGVPVGVIALYRVMRENKMFYYVLLGAVQVYVGFLVYYFNFDVKLALKRNDMVKVFEYFEKNMNKCDRIYSTDTNYNLFRKDLSYYWFIPGRLDVIGEKIGLRPIDDYNKIIEENKPKVLGAVNVIDYFENLKGNKVYIHKLDFEMIRKYYDFMGEQEKIKFGESGIDMVENEEGLYILKPEYQGKNCRLNEKTGFYEYEK